MTSAHTAGTDPGPRVIIAYNADAGLIAGMFDSLHKLVSPATYPCQLCALTHGLVTMTPAWRAWMKAPPVPVIVHHRPDFRAAFPAAADWPLPLVAIAEGDSIRPLLTPDTLAGIADAGALIAAITSQLAIPTPSA